VLSSIKDPALLAWLDANPTARAAAERQEAMASKFAHLDEVLKQAAKDEKRRKEQRMAAADAARVARKEASLIRRAEAKAAQKARLAAERDQAQAQRQSERQAAVLGQQRVKHQGEALGDMTDQLRHRLDAIGLKVPMPRPPRPAQHQKHPGMPTTDAARATASEAGRVRRETMEAELDAIAAESGQQPLVLKVPASWRQQQPGQQGCHYPGTAWPQA